MNGQWIEASPAFAQVVAIELNPAVAETKLIEAIKRGTLPAKVISEANEKFLSADLFRGRHGWIKVDWVAGTGVYRQFHFVQGEPPLAEWSFTDLLLGRQHLNELWPQQDMEKSSNEKSERPSYAKADAPIIAKMHDLIRRGDERSPTSAAWSLIGRDGAGAKGTSTPNSKVSRLVKAYKNRYKSGV